MESKKILIISPHPDDETLGVGGTILKLKENSNFIYWLIITGMNEKLGFSKEKILSREKEIEKVAEIYKFEDVFKLNFPTTRLDTIPMVDLVSKISDCIYKIKPEIIFVNNKSDIHTDHKITFQAVISATKPFRANFIKKILMYETISETDTLTSLSENIFPPNIYVDISNYIEKKLKIMSTYKSEIMNYPLPRSLDSIKALARYRGSQIGVEYAEAFMLVREIKI